MSAPRETRELASLAPRVLQNIVGGVGMSIPPSQPKIILTAAGAYKKLGNE